MIAFVDVGYQHDQARAACIVADSWCDETPCLEKVVDIDGVAAYQPGQFYLRELPCIEAVLTEIQHDFDIVVIDGYVTLDPNGSPGLGLYLFENLAQEIPVIGGGKTFFATASHAIRVSRMGSKRPLFVTAEGIDATTAAEFIRSMHGEHRTPTLLKRVDRLSRLST